MDSEKDRFLESLPPLQPGEYDIILQYYQSFFSNVHSIDTREVEGKAYREFWGFKGLKEGSKPKSEIFHCFRNKGDTFLMIDGVALEEGASKNCLHNLISQTKRSDKGFKHFRMLDKTHPSAKQHPASFVISSSFEDRRQILKNQIKESQDKASRHTARENFHSKEASRHAKREKYHSKEAQKHTALYKQHEQELKDLNKEELAWHEEKVRELKTLDLTTAASDNTSGKMPAKKKQRNA
eukprot:CAMPEP_0172447256 /NCGR_PEP_ID=MMETSP1065-20121228/6592_1 /TAXON_ID=265537 /ORGANISM="Amphiprora paludosa, Strain CCMP125" /LENGTH=238 /DNA_ID=CAMNT_0013198503 /DNA_START=5 /DNA_END=721 /DNA_ORIENTATION=-